MFVGLLKLTHVIVVDLFFYSRGYSVAQFPAAPFEVW